MIKEEWRQIKGFEEYEVSNLGRIRSHKYGKEKLLTIQTNERGYKRVNLYKDKKVKCLKVHRLVAEAFIPNPYDYPEVNHLNEDKSDNRVCNLEWCDRWENDNYGTRNKRISETMRARYNKAI